MAIPIALVAHTLRGSLGAAFKGRAPGTHDLPRVDVDVRADIADITRQLNWVQKQQVPFATMLALTWTAESTRERLKGEMRRVFDRPTPWTLNSMYIKPATKLQPIASVGHKDELSAPKGTPAGVYLQPQIHGGPRGLKRVEKTLRRRGHLPDGYFVVPGRAARLNKYGNISKGAYQRALSNIRATPAGDQDTPRGRRTEYFVGRINGTLGVWERRGRGRLRPFLIFVKQPRYKRRYDFFGVSAKWSAFKFPRLFRRALKVALSSGRVPVKRAA